MAGKPSAANEAARKQYEKAPADKKPTALALAAKHGLAVSSIYRSAWFKAPAPRAKGQS
jgi:hypothetical protein